LLQHWNRKIQEVFGKKKAPRLRGSVFAGFLHTASIDSPGFNFPASDKSGFIVFGVNACNVCVDVAIVHIGGLSATV
tara:strand:- start:51761 stop:51991 length:231 start_codon:yes stop_codon:yes gene_type:complete